VLDYVLSGCGVAAEAVLVLLLIRMRVFRTLPAFFLYICWSLLSDGLFLSFQFFYPTASFRIYEGQMVIDSAMIFAVLVELAWSVLGPIRSSLPKNAWIVIAILIALAGALVWPAAGLTLPGNLTLVGRDYFRLQQTFAILRVIVFLGLAGFSQLLSIGWRNRELQIATGLGFYSIVSLGIAVLHTHQVVGPRGYHWLDEFGVVCYLGSLGYWVLSFATKEVERQNFSPQMQNFLLLVGSTAKTSRAVVTDFVVTKKRTEDDK
jgi:hypothetical protein